MKSILKKIGKITLWILLILFALILLTLAVTAIVYHYKLHGDGEMMIGWGR